MVLLVRLSFLFPCLIKLWIDLHMLRGLIYGTLFRINIEFEREHFWIGSWLWYFRRSRTRQIQGKTHSIQQVAITSAILPKQNLLTTCRLRWKDEQGKNQSFSFGLLLPNRDKKRLTSEIRAFLK